MKRKRTMVAAFVLLGLVVLALCLAPHYRALRPGAPATEAGLFGGGGFGGETPKTEPVFVYVQAADTPQELRRSGPNVFQCDGAGNTDDFTVIQAAIDWAQGHANDDGYAGGAAPTVKLASGTYYGSTPIRVGYAWVSGYWHPMQNYGCNLIGDSHTLLEWEGSTDGADTYTWAVMFGPATSTIARDPELRDITLHLQGRVCGMFLNNVHNNAIHNLRIYNARKIGFLAADCWFGSIDGLIVKYTLGASAIYWDCNGARVASSVIHWGDGSQMPNLRAYYVTGSGSIYNGEILEGQGGAAGDDAVVISGYTSPILVAHTSGSDDWAHAATVTGASSGSSRTINITEPLYPKVDARAGVAICGGQMHFQCFGIEACKYTDQVDQSYNFPVVLTTQADAIVFDGVRLEGTFTGSGVDGRQYIKLADVIFKFQDSTHCAVRNLTSGFSTGTHYVAGCTVAGTLVTLGTSEYDGRFQDGDTIYLWAGSVTPGEYTIAASGVDDANDQITLTAAPGDSTADVKLHGLGPATREVPDILIELDNADQTLIEQVRGQQARTAYVQVDAASEDVIASQVWDRYGYKYADANWLYAVHPANNVENSGVRTQRLGIQQYDASAQAYNRGNDGTERDGVEIASASALAIGSAWGPNYKVYVSGVTAVTSITGGYLGQMITLIALHADGFTVTDGADLDVGTGNVDLAQYESITLICKAAAGNSWRVAGIEAYP